MKRNTDFLTGMLPAAVWLVPLLVCEPLSFCLSLLCAALTHEGGHLFAFFITRSGAPRLTGTPAGLLLTPKRQLSYPCELVIAAMGPAFNLALAFFLLLCAQFAESEALHLLIGVNVSCAMCNLLPIAELDGGRMLFSLCAIFLPLHVAEKIRKASSVLVLTVALFFSLWLILFLDIGYRILLSVIMILAVSDKNGR